MSNSIEFESVYGPVVVQALTELATPGDIKRRATAAQRLARIEQRLEDNMVVLEGDMSFDPEGKLLDEYHQLKTLCNIVAMTKFKVIIWYRRKGYEDPLNNPIGYQRKTAFLALWKYEFSYSYEPERQW